jgi:hypothetical protein
MTPIPPVRDQGEGTDGLACKPTGVCNSSCEPRTSGYVHAREKPVSHRYVWEIYSVPGKHHRVGDFEEGGQRGREDGR